MGSFKDKVVADLSVLVVEQVRKAVHIALACIGEDEKFADLVLRTQRLQTELDKLQPAGELLDYLRDEYPDFGEAIGAGHDVVNMFEGHFIAYNDVTEAFKTAWPQGLPPITESPMEYITELIDERDEVRDLLEEMMGRNCQCSPCIEHAGKVDALTEPSRHHRAVRRLRYQAKEAEAEIVRLRGIIDERDEAREETIEASIQRLKAYLRTGLVKERARGVQDAIDALNDLKDERPEPPPRQRTEAEIEQSTAAFNRCVEESEARRHRGVSIRDEAMKEMAAAAERGPMPDIPDEAFLFPVTGGAALIADERRRQIEVEDWTAEHDEQYTQDELVRAAMCYANPPHLRMSRLRRTGEPLDWPWAEWHWKPTPDDRVRELVKAGALIAAEIDRLQRKGGE